MPTGSTPSCARYTSPSGVAYPGSSCREPSPATSWQARSTLSPTCLHAKTTDPHRRPLTHDRPIMESTQTVVDLVAKLGQLGPRELHAEGHPPDVDDIHGGSGGAGSPGGAGRRAAQRRTAPRRCCSARSGRSPRRAGARRRRTPGPPRPTPSPTPFGLRASPSEQTPLWGRSSWGGE